MCKTDYVADIKAMIEMMVEDLGAEEAGRSMMDLRSYLKVRINQNHDIVRVLLAKQNESERIKPGTRDWWVHMRHCYGLNYDDHYGSGKPTERYSCKYGEDDICPAALFEDPWAEYVKAEDAEKAAENSEKITSN